jgi:Zn-dependent protease
METVAGNLVEAPPTRTQPAPIFNCPQCSHWLPEGTLACPDCQALVYAAHLRDIAIIATAHENAGQWPQARDAWREALDWLPAGTKQREAVEQRIALIDAKIHGVEQNKAKWARRLGPFAPILVFLSKLKTFFFILLKMKFLLSFVGFFGLYWLAFGWQFGLGFTLAILLHEMGHYVAARMRGLKVDLPVFLPGLGAYVRWYSMGISLETLSGIALAGPFAGLLTAIACGGIAGMAKSPLFSALAHVGAWINLINLVPVLGLDGAQATFSLDRTQRWLVLASALIFFGMLHEWPFLFIALGMAWRLWRGGDADKPSTKTLIQYVLLLFALGSVIALFPDSRRFGSF